MSPLLRTLHPPSLGASSSIYSHVAAIEGPAKIIYTAGQVGTDHNGKAPAEYENQIYQAYQNLGKCLEAAGATPKDIVKLTYFIVNYTPTNRAHVKVMEDFLGGHRPTTTLVPVPCLARSDLLFEVEAVAAITADSQYNIKMSPDSRGELRDVDVVIVGAGLSGLQAARDVHRAGLSYIILEARDRVGGKVWSKEASKGFVDLGAAWTNDINQPNVWRLGKELGLEFVEQNTDGDVIIQQTDQDISHFKYGETPQFSPQDQKDSVRIRDLVEALCHTIDIRHPLGYDDDTLENFVKKYHPSNVSLSTLAVWTRAMLGVEPSELSALYFFDYCKRGGGLLQMRSDREGGGQHFRCKTGMASLSDGLASMLSSEAVILDSPVTNITQTSPQKVIVKTRAGKEYRARKVIFSLPTPLYKDIKFLPELPSEKLHLSNATTLGYYSKMIVLYDKPWWKDSNLCGLSQSFVGPASITRDTSNAEAGQYSLTCFIVGEPGREWSKLPKQERKRSILSQLATIFGASHAEEALNPTEVFEQEWSKEEFSKGCPCPVMMPGTLSKFSAALKTSFGDIHFVGTETAHEWKGYMEGALTSGTRGAREAIEALTPQYGTYKSKL